MFPKKMMHFRDYSTVNRGAPRHDAGAPRCSHISKKKIRPGGMAPLEWTRTVRAVSDTPVEDSSAPGLNTTRRVAYRPAIAVSPLLLALSVSYVKRRLWCWGQWCPYVGMRSLGTRMHQDCNAIGEVVTISPLVHSTCAQNSILSLLIVYSISSRQIDVAMDNPSLVPPISYLTTSNYLWNYMHAANNVSHAEIFQSNCCRYFSQLYKFWDGIQVTQVFRYCGQRPG